jgi:hypothetical protein
LLLRDPCVCTRPQRVKITFSAPKVARQPCQSNVLVLSIAYSPYPAPYSGTALCGAPRSAIEIAPKGRGAGRPPAWTRRPIAALANGYLRGRAEQAPQLAVDERRRRFVRRRSSARRGRRLKSHLRGETPVVHLRGRDDERSGGPAQAGLAALARSPGFNRRAVQPAVGARGKALSYDRARRAPHSLRLGGKCEALRYDRACKAPV